MSAPVRNGDVLAGKYRVDRVLGMGGMGVVVAARHLQLDQPVALKFLLPEALALSEVVARFVREAKNAVQLKSEHVARIIDVGTMDRGEPYIVMEYLEGQDLAAILDARGAMAIETTVDYLLQACHALAEAHALGIIHRDLKPHNLFVTHARDGGALVKVLDFGISKSAATQDFAATRTNAVMGTPSYMSPEQMRSAKHVDPRTDVWSLGVILYQCATGRLPFEAESFPDLCIKVTMDAAPPFPPALKISSAYEAIVRRCLEKDPDQRYSDVHALALALAPFAPPQARPLVDRIGRMLHRDGGGQANHIALAPTAPPGAGTFGETAGERLGRTRVGVVRRRAALAATGVAIAACAIVIGAKTFGRSDTPAAAHGIAADGPAITATRVVDAAVAPPDVASTAGAAVAAAPQDVATHAGSAAAPQGGGTHAGSAVAAVPQGGGTHTGSEVAADPQGGATHAGSAIAAAPQGGGTHAGSAAAASTELHAPATTRPKAATVAHGKPRPAPEHAPPASAEHPAIAPTPAPFDPLSSPN